MAAAPESNDKQMDSFFKEVAAIKGQMADIRRNQGRLQEAHERSKMVTRSEEMKKLREQMQVSVVVKECVQLHFIGWAQAPGCRRLLQPASRLLLE